MPVTRQVFKEDFYDKEQHCVLIKQIVIWVYDQERVSGGTSNAPSSSRQRGIELTHQQLLVHHSAVSYPRVIESSPSVLCADDRCSTASPLKMSTTAIDKTSRHNIASRQRPLSPIDAGRSFQQQSGTVRNHREHAQYRKSVPTQSEPVLNRKHCPKATPKCIQYRDLRHINNASLISDALLLPWRDVWTLCTVDEKVQAFNNLVITLYDKHAPIKTRRITRPPAPWMTTEIRSLMRDRDEAFRKFKRLKNDLNNYFTSTTIHAPDAATKQQTINELISTPAPARDKFFFSYITPSDVKSVLKRIKSKSQGVDNINIELLNKIMDIILPTLTHIFNASIMTSHYPDIWKKAIVRSLPKIKLPVTPKDYRPISILPVLSKALERIVHKQLTDYLNTHNILDPYQSGFRMGHSTLTALLKVTEDIREALDKGQITILTFKWAWNRLVFSNSNCSQPQHPRHPGQASTNHQNVFERDWDNFSAYASLFEHTYSPKGSSPQSNKAVFSSQTSLESIEMCGLDDYPAEIEEFQ
ncbi:hypothetical protein ANN_22549 [Periplaneta americana]|uniref:Reverse transcriptase domain-containing protein n=1 Tax=Periplaneta americana TaxID=6978 RepID=A0ABQ8S8F4_PERAM|nr:hypothetical protein ANN_22549 [Periplaneta americana]